MQTQVVAADAAGIARAAKIIRDGGLVAVPTETVYGLAARADSADAVAAIYRAKGRPDFNPLIVHLADVEQAKLLAEWPDDAAQMAAKHWPGPLTMVLPALASGKVAPAVTAGLPTIAVRQPSHPVMQAVLDAAGLPLAAPSANRSNHVSPTCARHVLATLDGRIDLVLDGGDAKEGLESTILAWREAGVWELLRPGPIPSPVQTGEAASRILTGRVEAPGQLASHYSPGKPVRLNAAEAAEDEFHIGFGATTGSCNLSESGDLAVAASRLYACLHSAAASAMPRIAVSPIPDDGIGQAINDRLRRAAA